MSPAELDALSDEKWAEKFADLVWVREEEARFNQQQKAPTQ